MHTYLSRTDGSIELRTHGPVSEMSPAEADRLLRHLLPVVERLRERVAGPAPDVRRRAPVTDGELEEVRVRPGQDRRAVPVHAAR
jgi:hypothetical protein